MSVSTGFVRIGASSLTTLVKNNNIKAGKFKPVRVFHSSSIGNQTAGSSSAIRKRFYKKVGTVQSNKEFEVTLDDRKLKTPAGQIFRVSSEPLALAIANEWDAQDERILISSMHMTSLVNTILDNPNKLIKHDIVTHILTYLDNDTLLCREEGNSEWVSEQEKEWDPLVQWFKERYGVDMEPSTSITGPTLSAETRNVLIKHLHSFDFWALNGLMFAVEAAKSLILALACVDRRLTVEESVRLATLETEFQTRQWGRVEWAHDVDTFNLQARLAASVLLVHLTSSSIAIEGLKSKT